MALPFPSPQPLLLPQAPIAPLHLLLPQVPIAVRHTRAAGSPSTPQPSSSWRVVTWIDSKATFGDSRIHLKQGE